jgi:hypothetical protein
MRLYELKRGQQFTIDEGKLLNNSNDAVYTFSRLDGMYSICITEDGDIIHFSGNTPVIVIKEQNA